MLLWMVLLLQDLLGTDDIEAREKAAVDLLRGGEAALPELRLRRAEAVDPEIRARLQEVVERLETEVRRRSFGGGQEVGGLRARLVPIEKPLDGRLPCRLEIMNVGAAPRTFVPVRVLNVSLPGESRSRSSAHGRIAVKRLTGPAPTIYRCSSGCGGGPDLTAVQLRPGESRAFDLLQEERLQPGSYEASVTYFAARLLGAAEDLVSDTLRFEIKD